MGGLSLLERAIKTCRASCCAETYVSTEDAEIARLAAACGAQVIARPAELASDQAGTTGVLLHAVDAMVCGPDVIVWVQCTAPLATAADIDGCVQRLLRTGAAAAVAVTEFHGSVCREGHLERLYGVNWDMETPAVRRQEMPRQWVVAGSVWALDVRRLVESRQPYSNDCVGYRVGRQVDIDEPDDLRVANLLLPPAALPGLCYPL